MGDITIVYDPGVTTTPCCEPFSTVPCDECTTRQALGRALMGGATLRRIACAAGVAWDDMERFAGGEASLTGTMRERVRGACGS